ncbi:hypothetical protein B0H15DRAFT_1025464, partial [Mycena belliarum]
MSKCGHWYAGDNVLAPILTPDYRASCQAALEYIYKLGLFPHTLPSPPSLLCSLSPPTGTGIFGTITKGAREAVWQTLCGCLVHAAARFLARLRLRLPTLTTGICGITNIGQIRPPSAIGGRTGRPLLHINHDEAFARGLYMDPLSTSTAFESDGFLDLTLMNVSIALDSVLMALRYVFMIQRHILLPTIVSREFIASPQLIYSLLSLETMGETMPVRANLPRAAETMALWPRAVFKVAS